MAQIDLKRRFQSSRKEIIPSPIQARKFKRFYDCVYKLMESQLLAICKQTMSNYMNYILGVDVSRCHGGLECLSNSKID